jgi:hypothetical protein
MVKFPDTLMSYQESQNILVWYEHHELQGKRILSKNDLVPLRNDLFH